MSAHDLPDAKAPPRSLKERQRAEREALILQAAEAVLAEKGYHDTSMDEIAGRVGIAKGTIYLHYASKDDLVLALFAREITAFHQSIDRISSGPGSARARLEAILHYSYVEIGAQRRQLFVSLFVNTSMPQGVLMKQAAKGEHLTHVAMVIRALLEQGKAAGEFDTRMPTSAMLITFLNVLSPRSAALAPEAERLPDDELVGYVSRIFFRGIAPLE